jgi:Mg-chelatase subunit ChlD
MKALIKALKWIAIASLCLVLLAQPAGQAQADANTLGLRAEVDMAGFPAVKVNLSAWDSAGLPLPTLTPENITLREDDGAAFRPDSVMQDPNAALWVVLAVDVSTTMKGDPLDKAKEAAARFLDRLDAGDLVAVIAFSSPVDPDPTKLNVAREIGFSTDRTPAYDLVQGLRAEGGTHLYNAAAKSVRLFEGTPPGHRAVLLLTDGRNEPADAGDAQQAIDLAKQNDVPFFVIGLGNQVDETYLRRLAGESGGLFRSAPSSAELAQMFSQMAGVLKTQYQVSFTSRLPADGAKHNLSIQINWKDQTGQTSLAIGPLPKATETHVLAEVIATLPIPTDVPTLAPTDTPSQKQNGISWPLIVGGGLVLLVGLILLLRPRKPAPKPEVCAKCGKYVTGLIGACPVCGEPRRLPKVK